jgi:hypothetical protein
VIVKALDSLAASVPVPGLPQQIPVHQANMAPTNLPDDGKVMIDNNTDDTVVIGDARLKRHAGW